MCDILVSDLLVLQCIAKRRNLMACPGAKPNPRNKQYKEHIHFKIETPMRLNVCLRYDRGDVN